MAQPRWITNSWRVNSDVAVAGTWNGSDTLTMKAAPATGYSLFVTDVTIIQGGTSRVFNLLDGNGGTVLFKSVLTASTGQTFTFAIPIKLTTATLLQLTSAGASTGAMVLVGGFTARG